METEFTPKAPDYSGDGIAIWKSTDKNGKTYLKVSVLKGKPIACFKVEPKPESKDSVSFKTKSKEVKDEIIKRKT